MCRPLRCCYGPTFALRATVGKKGGHDSLDAALGQAIVLARGNRNADAARVYAAAIAQAPRGSVGWLLPVEPLLHPLGHREIWDEALTMIRVRAT